MGRNLIVKALAGFLALLAALCLLIFLPAGTLNYSRAWLYLLVFFGSSLLITLYLFKHDAKLLERRVKAGPAAEKEKNQIGIQAMANLSFCAVYITAGFDFRFHWSEIPWSVSVIFDVLAAAGFYIVFLVFKENTYTSAIIEVAAEQEVISTGPYGIVRHPMYSGALLMMLVTPLALGSYWALVPSILLAGIIVLRLLDEEEFLTKNLTGYTDYCQKVRYHLIPYLW